MPIDQIGPRSENERAPSSGMWAVVHKYGRMVFPRRHIPHPTWNQAIVELSGLLSGRLLGSRLKGIEGKAVWVAQPTDETIRPVETALLRVVGVAPYFFY